MKLLKSFLFLSIVIIQNSFSNSIWKITDGLDNLKPEPGKALCIVLRAHGYSEYPVDIYLDQWKVGYTHENTLTYFSVDTGTHYISLGKNINLSYERNFREGEIFYLYQSTTVETFENYMVSYITHRVSTEFINKKKFYSIFESKKSILALYKVTPIESSQLSEYHFNRIKSNAIFIPLSKEEVYNFVLNKVKDVYVDEQLNHVTLDTTGHPPIDTLLNQLDQYSRIYYLEEEDALQSGELGMNIQKLDSNVVITSVRDEGPAAGRGVFRDDTLISINNSPVKDLDTSSIRQMLYGPIGSTVTLKIKRGNNTLTIRNIKREELILKTVDEPLILEDRIGYVKVNSFEANTEPQINDAVDTLVDDSRCKVVILDLRNNNGGLFSSAIDVSELFLPRGDIICKVVRSRSGKRDIFKSKDGEYRNVKLIVLINENSYSAAEILSRALKGNKRALFIGTKTKGKGCMQSVFPINSDMAVSLTTAYLVGPNGAKIHKVGIKPHIEVDMGEYSMDEKVYSQLSLRYPENRDPQLKVAVREAQKMLKR